MCCAFFNSRVKGQPAVVENHAKSTVLPRVARVVVSFNSRCRLFVVMFTAGVDSGGDSVVEKALSHSVLIPVAVITMRSRGDLLSQRTAINRKQLVGYN